MGATIITDKLVAATKGADGKLYYFLYEETYEKNVYPHTPHWGCWYIGTIEGALRRIFLAAGSCESGMLRSRRGDIKPENFVKDWYKELANPVLLSLPNLKMKMHGGFDATVPTEKQEFVVAAFKRHGHPDLAQQLLSGGVLSLSFSEHAAMLSEIYNGNDLGPWRLVRGTPHSAERTAEYGYKPKPVRHIDLPKPPSIMRVPNGKFLVADEQGAWRNRGEKWEILQDFITSCWRTELAEPGSYKVRIEALREALDVAPPMPPGMSVAVDERVELDGYLKSTVEGLRYLGTPTSTGYTIDVGADVLQDSNLLWRICHLPRVCTSWEIGKCVDEAADDFASRQMDMFV
ncbi:hypothetical protein [Simplicispira suum]|nr:hypothetical protein [Simplicispira suum]